MMRGVMDKVVHFSHRWNPLALRTLKKSLSIPLFPTLILFLASALISCLAFMAARVLYAPFSRVTFPLSSSISTATYHTSILGFLFLFLRFLGKGGKRKPKGEQMFLVVYFLFFSLGQCSVDFNALLSFKDSVFDPSNSLSSWVNSSNPCADSWYGVTCNPTTHRVTRLVLENLNLSGSTQPLSQLSHLRLLSVKNNRLFSSSVNFSSWFYIRHLYLSGNRFSGEFPAGISNLKRLHRLDLSRNNFTGKIPMAELTGLPFLLTLHLESNSFTGPLNSIASFSSIIDFNVSNNKLSGEIPAWMSRFPASSFEGNKDLCGRPMQSDCFNQTALPAPLKPRILHPETKSLSDRVVLMIIAVDVVAVTAALATITWCCYRYKCCSGGTHKKVLETKSGSKLRRRSGSRERELEAEEMVVFEGCNGFRKVGDLLKSSAELLGKGSVGTTYKVVTDGGDVVVVKRVRQRRRRRRDVDGWLRVIGGLRHANIMSLKAYYNSKEELLLVYDFLPNGSLHSLLHGNRGPGRTPLTWSTRLKLASGAAQGLAFIHGYRKAKIFHGHLTSSNILVDRQGSNALISDFGLHQVLHALFLSNDDYKAPELMHNNNGEDGGLVRKYTQKCDVYSFGVILLEILTGKMVSGESGMSLVKWIQSVGKEEWAWEVFDFEMLGDKQMEEEMVGLMQVALLCVATLPKDRPKMSMVHRMIEDIQTKGARNGGTICILNDFSSDSSPALSERTPSFK